MNEQAVLDAFQEWLSFIKDVKTFVNRDYAFIEFFSSEYARKASFVKEIQIHGQPVSVQIALHKALDKQDHSIRDETTYFNPIPLD